ncbi:MAG: hypothetical protein ABFD76_05045 [Smithella sp.]
MENQANSIKILGHEYQHIQTDKLALDTGTPGQCCMASLWIKTDSTVPKSRQEEALLHEIFEALRYHLNCQDTFSHQLMSTFSEALYQVIKDNPKYFKLENPIINSTSTLTPNGYPGKVYETSRN